MKQVKLTGLFIGTVLKSNSYQFTINSIDQIRFNQPDEIEFRVTSLEDTHGSEFWAVYFPTRNELEIKPIKSSVPTYEVAMVIA